MIYHTFAQLYDQLFDPDLYKQWRDYTLANCPEKTSRVLDLAGGAGRLAVLLAHAGLDMTVADISEDMLALASQHAEEEGVRLQIVQADMRDLTQFPQYDLVTCFADSLCYLPALADVKATFRQVYAHLRPAGKFLFDMITPYQTDEVYPGYMYNYEDEDHQRAFMWQSYQDDDVKHGVIHDLTFFNRLADGEYERVSETHYERAYQLAALAAALRQAGFASVKVSADFGRKQPGPQTTRWFFDCQK